LDLGENINDRVLIPLFVKASVNDKFFFSSSIILIMRIIISPVWSDIIFDDNAGRVILSLLALIFLEIDPSSYVSN